MRMKNKKIEIDYNFEEFDELEAEREMKLAKRKGKKQFLGKTAFG